jgi:purine-cytosine permease-like protein
MLWLVVPTSVAGFALGYRLHRETRIVAIGAAAVAVLALAALWGHDAWGRTFETAANVAASLVLAYAHWRNFREVRRVHRHG